MGWCYINGQFLDEKQATIPIDNLGVQRGFGVFDLFRTRERKPTFLEDYLDRFEKSQHFLQLDRIIEKTEIRNAVEELQLKNDFRNSTFKLILLGSGNDTDASFEPFFYIINTRIEDHIPLIEANVITHEYQREYPEIKTLNYQTSYLLHREKMKANAVDVIYHKDGIVTEASRSNLFIVKEGQLKTPSKNILGGINRLHLLKLTPSIIETPETDIIYEEVINEDEVVICST
jgi:branched-subunit amino acid aminotransferase/4-amino-4-deoxychorismate lyase